MTRPLIVAHRGASATAPENTLAAFRAGIEAGAEGVEFDVRLTKDGVPVVFHDPDLVRTAGMQANVADLGFNELASVDVGSWFSRAKRRRPPFAAVHPRTGTPSDFSDQRIPKLADVLELFRPGSGPVFVELKCDRPCDAGPLVEATCDAIEASGLPASRVIVKSFELSALPLVRGRLPEVGRAALFAPKLVRLLRRGDLVDTALRVGATDISLHRALINSRVVARANDAGLRVTAWTVDSPAWLSRRKDIGLFAVITNDPAALLRAV